MKTQLAVCPPNDANGKLMQLANFIVIDEVSMGQKFVLEALDRSLQDIRNCLRPFGGITVLFAGDWRQVLPVVRHGSRPYIVNSTLKMSYLWTYVHPLKLKENMQVKLTGESADFSNFLRSVGNGSGKTQAASGGFKQELPADLFVRKKDDLIRFVFQDMTLDTDWLLCATNSSADEINDNVLSLMSTNDEKEYCDLVEENEHQYPIEFINKLCPSGLPPNLLLLKKHCIIMLLRNLDPQNGHCNGTRYIVENYTVTLLMPQLQ
ncbi:ATP-dependent DNA helicase PIF1 [Elysia marginata]|uniref:ATP-dependent DNA helicase n=1 Tax=Elysia marginata TaxID=1093978 RepID=A0AAV4FC06_9GAST|nr:ATP-dependent DNA helicase PIF1 [Elysia marginata]